MATTLSKIFHQLLDDYAISLSYQKYAEKFGMTILSNTRKCVKCGQLASIKHPLYPSKGGKLCRKCLPFIMTITEGKTKRVITDWAQFDAYNRKELWEQAYYEICNEERRRLDTNLFKLMDTLPLYLAERKWCRLCNSRVSKTTKTGDAHRLGFSKYHQYGTQFRTQVFLKMKIIFEEWQKHWYYKTVWRFDPIKERLSDCMKPIGFNYKWEQFYPLLNDPAIHSAGVEIGARVEVGDVTNGSLDPYVKGRVVFRRIESVLYCDRPLDPCKNQEGKKNCVGCQYYTRKSENIVERGVECTHVAIASIPITDIPDSSVLDSKGREWAKTTEGNKEVKLAPEEHYVALRSFVAGIAEVGLETMFASRYPDDPLSLPFGFNTLMQKQVLYCLKELCPNAAKSIIYKAVGYVLESAPDEWILQRKSLLNDTYGFTTVLEEHEFWEMADAPTQKRIVALLGKLVPQIPKDYWHDPIRGRNIQNVIYAPAAEGLHPGQPAEGVRGHHPDIVVTYEHINTRIEYNPEGDVPTTDRIDLQRAAEFMTTLAQQTNIPEHVIREENTEGFRHIIEEMVPEFRGDRITPIELFLIWINEYQRGEGRDVDLIGRVQFLRRQYYEYRRNH